MNFVSVSFRRRYYLVSQVLFICQWPVRSYDKGKDFNKEISCIAFVILIFFSVSHVVNVHMSKCSNIVNMNKCSNVHMSV
jgi:hypothetical protein